MTVEAARVFPIELEPNPPQRCRFAPRCGVWRLRTAG